MICACPLCLNPRRAAEKQATVASDNEPDEEPAPTSDVEPEEDAPKKKPKKGKGKGSGGIKIPEEWPWEEAKKLFEKPDVIPAEEVEVGTSAFHNKNPPEVGLNISSSNGRTLTSMAWCNF